MEKQLYKKKCKCCKKLIPVLINPDDYEKIINREGRIQDIVPYLTPGERELFLSGLCNDCYDKIFLYK